ncbi:SRPBCC family protein [Rhodococcus aerolatus]
MDLEHSFSVDAPIDVVWKAFNEPDRVAPCFPGATLTDSTDTTFTGTVKVKLGPIAMLYKGVGEFVETDEAAHRAVIDARGKDSRGNGQASAKVTATLTANGDDKTDVVVLTDLSITGKPAQLGRGLIAEVGGKIIGQFADCLGQRLGAEQEAASEPAAATEAPAAPVTDGAASTLAGTPSAASTAGGVGGPSTGAGTVTPSAAPATPAPAAKKPVNYPPTPDAIDLLDSGGSAVAKRVAPVAGAAVVGGLVVWLVMRKK